MAESTVEVLERCERWLREHPDHAPVGLYGEVQEALVRERSTVVASEDPEQETFTYFLPDGLLRVNSNDVVTAFIRAREAVDLWCDGDLAEWSNGEGWEVMRRLEVVVYPERRDDPSQAEASQD